MAEIKGRLFLKDKDFVAVVDEDGNDLPPVPKHWGEDQLPAGAKKKGRSSSGSTSTGSGSSGSGQGGIQPAVPAGNASREDWAKYAVDVKGAKPEDLVDADGNELGRDELKAKFAPTGD